MEFLSYRRIKNIFITDEIRFNLSFNIFWLFDNFDKLVTLYNKTTVPVHTRIIKDYIKIIILLCYCSIIYA